MVVRIVRSFEAILNVFARKYQPPACQKYLSEKRAQRAKFEGFGDACNQPASIFDREPPRVKVRLLTRRIRGPHRGATCAFGLVDFPKGLHQEASAGSAVAPSQRTLTASHAPMVQLASYSTSPEEHGKISYLVV